jgi:hypothetical protein
MLQALIVVVMTGAGIRVALSAFYWPWALASAVQTVHSNPPKWRLVSCGRLLADRWSDEVDAALTEGIESRTEEVQAAVAYVLAGTGEKSALVRLVHIAQSMPSVSAETPAEPAIEERGISSQEDVLWLVAGLTDTEYGSLAEFTGQEGADLAALVWDPRKGRYIHAGQGAQE